MYSEDLDSVDTICNRILGTRSAADLPHVPAHVDSNAMLRESRKLLARLQSGRQSTEIAIDEDFTATENNVLVSERDQMILKLQSMKTKLQDPSAASGMDRRYPFTASPYTSPSSILATQLDINDAKSLLQFSAANPAVMQQIERAAYQRKIEEVEITNKKSERCDQAAPHNQPEALQTVQALPQVLPTATSMPEELRQELAILRKQQIQLLEAQNAQSKMKHVHVSPTVLPQLVHQDPQLLKCLQEIKADNESNQKANQRLAHLSSAIVEANNSLRIERQRMEQERQVWRRERTMIAHEAAELKKLRDEQQRERELLAASQTSVKVLQMMLGSKNMDEAKTSKNQQSIYVPTREQSTKMPTNENKSTEKDRSWSELAIQTESNPQLSASARRRPTAVPRKLPPSAALANRQLGIAPIPRPSPITMAHQTGKEIDGKKEPIKLLPEIDIKLTPQRDFVSRGVGPSPITTSAAHTQTLASEDKPPQWDSMLMNRADEAPISGVGRIPPTIPPTTLITLETEGTGNHSKSVNIYPTIPILPEQEASLLASGLRSDINELTFASSPFDDILREARSRKRNIRRLYGVLEADPQDTGDPTVLTAVRNVVHELVAADLKSSMEETGADEPTENEKLVQGCILELLNLNPLSFTPNLPSNPAHNSATCIEPQTSPESVKENIPLLPLSESDHIPLATEESEDILSALKDIVASLIAQPAPPSTGKNTAEANTMLYTEFATTGQQTTPPHVSFDQLIDPPINPVETQLVVSSSSPVVATSVGKSEITLRVILDAAAITIPAPLPIPKPPADITMRAVQTEHPNVLEKSVITEPMAQEVVVMNTPLILPPIAPPLMLVPLDESNMSHRKVAFEPLAVPSEEVARIGDIEEIELSSTSDTTSSSSSSRGYSSSSSTSSRSSISYRRHSRRKHRSPISSRSQTITSTTTPSAATIYRPSQLLQQRRERVDLEASEAMDRKLLEVLEYEELAELFDRYVPRHTCTSLVKSVPTLQSSPLPNSLPTHNNLENLEQPQCAIGSWVQEVVDAKKTVNPVIEPKAPSPTFISSDASQSSTHLSSYGPNGIHAFYITEGLKNHVPSSDTSQSTDASKSKTTATSIDSSELRWRKNIASTR